MLNPTEEQKQLADSYEAVVLPIARQLLTLARQYHNAIVKLPHENKDGTLVTHGCNRYMDQCCETLILAARELVSYEAKDAIQAEFQVRLSDFRFWKENEYYQGKDGHWYQHRPEDRNK